MTPNKKIEILARKHKNYILYCEAWLNNDNKSYAEDVVQAAYYSLLKRLKANPDKNINEAYFYLTLRSIMVNESKVTTDPLKHAIAINDRIIPNNISTTPIPDYTDIKESIDKLVSTFYEFDKLLFNAYRYEFKTIRQLSKDTKLGHVTVFKTVKRCKEKINKELRDKYYGKE